MTIHVDVLSDDRLSRQRYSFMVLSHFGAPKMVFDDYREEGRQTTRHGFKLTGKRWSRLEKRARTIDARPDVPEHVKEQAKSKLVESIIYDF